VIRSQARARARRRIGAATLAVVAHAVIFSLLLFGGGVRFSTREERAATQVWLAPPLILTPRRPPPTQPRGAPRTVSRIATSPSAEQSARAAPPPAPSLPPSSIGAGSISAALRRSVGCAQPDAPWMSDADRAACRQRLASGAERAPHLEGMPATKLAYFTAVAKAQDDWLSGRNPGHGFGIGCAIRFGKGAVQAAAARAAPGAMHDRAAPRRARCRRRHRSRHWRGHDRRRPAAPGDLGARPFRGVHPLDCDGRGPATVSGPGNR
jgi:hypothetical protein